jgi:hypothetical protein
MYICETCGEQVRPKSDSDIVYAVELIETKTMGEGRQYSEGLGVFFHDRCYPGGSRYRRKPMPENVDDGDD